MTCETLQAPEGTYKLLKGAYDSRCDRRHPKSHWNRNITASILSAKKNSEGYPVETAIVCLDRVKRRGMILTVYTDLGHCRAVVHQLQVGFKDAILSLQTAPNAQAIHEGFKVPPADINYMLSTFRTAFRVG